MTPREACCIALGALVYPVATIATNLILGRTAIDPTRRSR